MLVAEAPFIHVGFKYSLQSYGHTVMEANEFSEAVELFNKHKATLDFAMLPLLLSYGIKGSSALGIKVKNSKKFKELTANGQYLGIYLTQMFLKDKPGLPIIISDSLNNDNESVRKTLNLGACGYIKQPCGMPRFQSSLERILGYKLH